MNITIPYNKYYNTNNDTIIIINDTVNTNINNNDNRDS